MKATDAPTFRDMTPGDIEAGLRFCRASGWNQREEDWRRLLAQGAGRFRAAVVDGRVVGTGGIAAYGTLGWVCMILVDPSERGWGIGSAIVADLLTLTSGLDTIGLDATPGGRPVYAKLGFRDAAGLVRLESGPREGAAPPAGVRPLAPSDLEAALAWDREVFGADRGELLRWALEQAPEYAWCSGRAGALDGYCFGRHGHRWEQVGPVVARGTETAGRLVAACVGPQPDRRFVIDVPDDRPEWIESLVALGFATQRPFTRMYLGDARPPGRPALQLAIFGPEFS
jgi:GNAT superfamily N-acetyltransferase